MEENNLEIITLDNKISLKICGVEFGDITEMFEVSINSPLDATIEIRCDLKSFLKKMQAIKGSH